MIFSNKSSIIALGGENMIKAFMFCLYNFECSFPQKNSFCMPGKPQQ